MNLINKSIFLLTCFSVLSCNASGCEKINSEAKIIQEIRDEIKKQFDADEADEIINDLVQDALKKCGIKRPIIVLQRRGGDNSYAYSCPSKHPQEFIIVGTEGEKLDQITFSIYHEVGHLAHGDLLFQKRQFDCYYARGSMVLSSVIGLFIGLRFYKFMKNPIVGLAAGVAIGGMSTVLAIALGAGYKFYRDSLKELKADTFAYDNLVKHGKLNAAIMRISDFLYTYEFNSGITQLPAFVCGYPNDLQRAQNGLNVFAKTRY